MVRYMDRTCLFLFCLSFFTSSHSSLISQVRASTFASLVIIHVFPCPSRVRKWLLSLLPRTCVGKGTTGFAPPGQTRTDEGKRGVERDGEVDFRRGDVPRYERWRTAFLTFPRPSELGAGGKRVTSP